MDVARLGSFQMRRGDSDKGSLLLTIMEPMLMLLELVVAVLWYAARC